MIKFTIITLFLCAFTLSAQTDTLTLAKGESVIIDSIRITGNDKTEEYIILRELSFGPGDTLDINDLSFARERVLSLQLFYAVDLYIIKTNPSTYLEINVKETWYIFPVPIVRIQDNDITKSNYGAALVYNNFRGRNETIKATIMLGYDPSYSLSFFSPVFIRDMDISFSAGFVYQSINNKSINALREYGEDFSYDSFTGTVQIGKRLNLFHEVFFIAGYQYVEAPRFLNGISASNKNIDVMPSLGVAYQYDSRNLKQFADNGIFFGVSYIHKGFGVNTTNYNVIRMDFREYRGLLGYLFGKWRVATRNTFGKKIPYYDYSYLGFSEYIRGHKQSEREGHNSLITSLEFNYPIISNWEFSIDVLFLPRSLTSTTISIYLTAFADAGLTYNNRERVSFNDFDSGYGGGITFIFLPRNAFRLEYAYNKYGVGEFILGTKLSF